MLQLEAMLGPLVIAALTLSVGGKPLPLEAVLRVDMAGGAHRPSGGEPFAFRADGHAELRTPGKALRVRLDWTAAGTRPGAELRIEGTFDRSQWVRRIAVELRLPADDATVVGRDLEPAPAGTALLERFDPKWISVARGEQRMAIVIDDSVDVVTIRRAGGVLHIEIALEDTAARPFLHDTACKTRWRAPNPHISVAARFHRAEDRLRARVQFLPAAWATALVKAHFPDGRRAALVITDHADQSSLRTLAALAYGRSDAASACQQAGASPRSGCGGLIGHHLAITKALFARGGMRPQLEDERVVAVADDLHRGLSDIVPHSATPLPDSRAATESALMLFERWQSHTWIDHQPETNCEAFGDQGFRSHGRFGIADLLVAHGYRYVWAEEDVPGPDLNMLEPRHLDRLSAVLYPIGRLDERGPDTLWMFRSQWVFVEAPRFYALYSPERIDRLERERGIHVAHTYLETLHPRGTVFGARNLLRGGASGSSVVELDPRFDGLLANLQARVERGTLWMPTLAELGDQLRAMAAVTLTIDGLGGVVVHAPAPVPGATFLVGRPGVFVDGANGPVNTTTADGASTLFHLDLPAGDTRLDLRTSLGPLYPAVE